MIRKKAISAVKQENEKTGEIIIHVGTVIRHCLRLSPLHFNSSKLSKQELMDTSVNEAKKCILALIYGSIHTELDRMKGMITNKNFTGVEKTLNALLDRLNHALDEKEEIKYETIEG